MWLVVIRYLLPLTVGLIRHCDVIHLIMSNRALAPLNFSIRSKCQYNASLVHTGTQQHLLTGVNT